MNIKHISLYFNSCLTSISFSIDIFAYDISKRKHFSVSNFLPDDPWSW